MKHHYVATKNHICARVYMSMHLCLPASCPILKGKNMIELFIKSGTSIWYEIDKNQSKIWTMRY